MQLHTLLITILKGREPLPGMVYSIYMHSGILSSLFYYALLAMMMVTTEGQTNQ